MFRAVLISALAIIWVLAPQTAQAQFTSNTFQATEGVFTTDVDNFADVNEYDTVDPENFFLYGQTRTDVSGSDSTGVSFGFAKTFGFGYLGIGYQGVFWDGNSSTQETPTQTNHNNNNDTGLQWDNFINILYGNPLIGGIRLDACFDNAGNDNDDVEPSSGATAENSKGRGTIELGLAWGKNFGLGSGTFKLHADAAYLFDLRDTESSTGAVSQVQYQGEEEWRGTSYTTGTIGHFSGNIGGAYEFESGYVTTSLELGYGLTYYRYPDRLDETETNGTVTAYTDTNPSRMEHEITLGFSQTRDISNRLQLGYGAGVTFGYAGREYTNGETLAGGVTTEATEKYSASLITLSPLADIGFIYTVSPGKFKLNAGLRLNITSFEFYELETVDSSVPANVVTTTVTEKTIGGMSSVIGMGFTWTIIPGFDLDAVASINSASLNAATLGLQFSVKR
jgi:hypothetical protein